MPTVVYFTDPVKNYFMGRFDRTKCTVHLISAPNQPGWKQMYYSVSSLFKAVTIYGIPRMNEILMITLISSKKLGLYKIMRNTVPIYTVPVHII